MGSRPCVLLYDDGELDWVRAALDRLGIPLDHVQGSDADDLQGPYELIVTTAQRAAALAAVRDLRAGDCVSICAHSQDFLPLRERLRSLGFDFLVHGRIEPQMLRLLLLHVVYRGPEKRGGRRLPVGAAASCRIGSQEQTATLVDLAPDGCRLIAPAAAPPGTPVIVQLPEGLSGGRRVELSGSIVRTETDDGAAGGNTLAVSFDELTPASARVLHGVLQGHAIGTRVTALSEAAPGRADAEDDPESDPEPEILLEEIEQRDGRRVAFRRRVVALHNEAWRVVLGRDLSVRGMRVEPTLPLRLGVELDVEIYGQPGVHPVRVHAIVARDDAEGGLVLRFLDNDAEVIRRIEQIVNASPAIESFSSTADEQVVVSVVAG